MIHYHVEMQDLTKIEAALGMMKDKSKMVLRSAINNAAKQTEKRLVNEAHARYKYHDGKSGIKKANTVKKAKVSNMTAIIEAKGPANELLDFNVQPRTYYPAGRGAPKWIRSRGRRDSKLTRVARRPTASGDKYKGFVVRYQSGHLAVVERVPGKKMKSKPHKEAIESLYSIATPKMEEVVYKDEISDDMYDLLQQSIQTQILRYLK